MNVARGAAAGWSQLAQRVPWVIVAILVACAVIASAGRDPVVALRALAVGAFGSPYGLASVGTKACPLILVGLAIMVAFRAGFWNIGAEGQIVMGAIAAGAIGAHVSAPAGVHVVLVLLAAAVAGALWCGIAAWLRWRRGALEVISTILLNFVALFVLSWLVHGPLMQASGAQPIGDPLAATARIPRLLGATLPLHAGVLFAVAMIAAVHWFLFRTETGFRLRVVGRNPDAATWAGIHVPRTVWIAAATSGAIAGMAGAIEVMGVLGRLFDKVTPGYGFTGIAVAMLARLRPAAVLPSALLFAALETGSSRMQQEADVSHALVLVIQGVVILASIATGRGTPRREGRVWSSRKAS